MTTETLKNCGCTLAAEVIQNMPARMAQLEYPLRRTLDDDFKGGRLVRM